MGLLTVAANGQSLTVDLHRPGGARPSTFSDAGLTTPITLPLDITADQDFYFRSGTNIVTVTVTTAAGVTLLSSVQHEVGDTDHVVVTPLPTAAQEAATDSAASGGPVAGVLRAVTVVFNEPAAPHADLTATVPITAGTTVADVTLIPVVGSWADPVALTMSDTLTGAASYFDAYDVGGLSTYVVSAPGVGVNYDTLADAGAGAYIHSGVFERTGTTRIPLNPGIRYASTDALTFTLAGIATGGNGGQLLVRVFLLDPVTAIVAA